VLVWFCWSPVSREHVEVGGGVKARACPTA
jgi:hypothetical protein